MAETATRIRRFSPEDVRDAQAMVRPVCYPHGNRIVGHWELSAYVLLTGVALHLAYIDANKMSLQDVAEFVCDLQWCMDSRTVFLMMRTYPHDALHHGTWRDNRTDRPTPTHPVVARVAGIMLEMSSDEREAVIRVARSFLSSHFIPPSVLTRSN